MIPIIDFPNKKNPFSNLFLMENDLISSSQPMKSSREQIWEHNLIFSTVWTPPPLIWGGLQANDPIPFQGAIKFWEKWGDLSAVGGPLYLRDSWGLIYKYCDDGDNFRRYTPIIKLTITLIAFVISIED